MSTERPPFAWKSQHTKRFPGGSSCRWIFMPDGWSPGSQLGMPRVMGAFLWWYCWWFKKSGVYQLRLVVYPSYLQGFTTIQTVVWPWDFWTINSANRGCVLFFWVGGEVFPKVPAVFFFGAILNNARKLEQSPTHFWTITPKIYMIPQLQSPKKHSKKLGGM